MPNQGDVASFGSRVADPLLHLSRGQHLDRGDRCIAVAVDGEEDDDLRTARRPLQSSAAQAETESAQGARWQGDVL
jgi:hypothetical protein